MGRVRAEYGGGMGRAWGPMPPTERTEHTSSSDRCRCSPARAIVGCGDSATRDLARRPQPSSWTRQEEEELEEKELEEEEGEEGDVRVYSERR